MFGCNVPRHFFFFPCMCEAFLTEDSNSSIVLILTLTLILFHLNKKIIIIHRLISFFHPKAVSYFLCVLNNQILPADVQRSAPKARSLCFLQLKTAAQTGWRSEIVHGLTSEWTSPLSAGECSFCHRKKLHDRKGT